MSFFILGTALLAAVSAVQAAPAMRPRQSVSAISSSQMDTYTPYTSFAGAAYCPASETATWQCGGHCDANSGFEPIATGGNGDSVQYWYVGFDPSLDSIVVAHQGTNPSQMLSLVTDADIIKTKLDSSLFPGMSSDIEVHRGFADAQSSTASSVLAAVQSGISKYGASKIDVVGHSLGAAIALLDLVYLSLHISGTPIFFYGYGLPRVGNQAFANYVDGMGVSVTHITNKEDPIPTVPGMFLGFVHPSGEIHIEDSNAWDSCPGQDNSSKQCSTGAVSSVASGTLSDHDGPYNGITMGCS